MRLVGLSVAWVAGIYSGSLLAPPLYPFLAALILPLLLVLLGHRRQACLWGGLGLAVFLLGILWFNYKDVEPTLGRYNAGVVEIRGEVERDPSFEGGTSSLRLSAHEIRTDGDWQEVSGKVLIHTVAFPFYSQGEQLKVSGELQPLPDYMDYLIGQDFRSQMYYPQIELVERGWLVSLRDRLSRSLTEALPEPQVSLAQALLLGIRSSMPESVVADFRETGTTHLIAISGLHVAILVGIVLSAGAWLLGRQRPTYILVALGAIWLYVMLTGMRPPALRAGIMFTLLLAALWLGRPRSALPAIALAAAIMVGIDPSTLWDVSFQLSFVAVAGLLFLMPPLQGLGRRLTEGKTGTLASIANPIIDSLAVALAAIIATFPLIAYHFDYVSLTALPTTILALLALPGAIITTLVVALLGLIVPALSWITSWAAWLFLSYILKVVETFGSLPFASYNDVGPIDGAWLAAFYGVLMAILFRKRLGMAISRLAASVR